MTWLSAHRWAIISTLVYLVPMLAWYWVGRWVGEDKGYKRGLDEGAERGLETGYERGFQFARLNAGKPVPDNGGDHDLDLGRTNG